jgi:predicted enzyme related to lactoylglutathione lyase
MLWGTQAKMGPPHPPLEIFVFHKILAQNFIAQPRPFQSDRAQPQIPPRFPLPAHPAFATFVSYLGSPRRTLTSGLYLHSPALEGLWMEAYQSTWGGCACAKHLHRLSLASTGIKATRREVMSHAGNHHHINYIEFASTDIAQTKKFYSTAFGWSFVDYGPDYVSFHGAGIDGGFVKRDPQEAPCKHAPLVVLYSSDLAATEIAVRMEGGGIVVPTFEFPGGRRFHFSDGVGNILAVWSE